MIETEENGVGDHLYVIKRNGKRDTVKFDEISARIERLCKEIKSNIVDPPQITIIVSQKVVAGITTTELDNLAAEAAMTLSVKHVDYEKLAARIAIDNLHKETDYSFSEIISRLYEANQVTGARISQKIFQLVQENAASLDAAIDYDRDFLFDFTGFRAIEPFLLKLNGHIVERPQHLFMRIALGMCLERIDDVIDLYNLISQQYFFPTTNVLLTCTDEKPHFVESYIIEMKDDSLCGIYDSLTETAVIARAFGNIGFNIHCIRAFGSYIAGTNGASNGIPPMLRVYNDSFRYVGNSGERLSDNVTDIAKKIHSYRFGHISVYLEPWHADILEFLELKKSGGKEEVRARDLDYAIWIPDLFMKRVEADENWSLMCPHECSNLYNTYGVEFEKIYLNYENEKRYRKQIKAQQLWQAIYQCQIETGFPSVYFKDTCNRLSNQTQFGVIQGGSYQGECITYTSSGEIQSVVQGAVSLPKFVSSDRNSFDLNGLKDTVKRITKYLDNIIEVTEYPNKLARDSAEKHRQIGIGVQGLADVFMLMRYAFDSPEAKELNLKIFETIYFAALECSCELAIKFGRNKFYDRSPLVNGCFHFELTGKAMFDISTSQWKWDELREKIKSNGIRNGLLISLWQTELSAKIFSEISSIEPLQSNVQQVKLFGVNFFIVNKHLQEELRAHGLWNESIRHEIINHGGSVQNISSIPETIRQEYKTSFEIAQRAIIEMAAERSLFIDQNQSFFVYMQDPSYAKITSMHFFAWRNGLKSSMYCLKKQLTK